LRGLSRRSFATTTPAPAAPTDAAAPNPTRETVTRLGVEPQLLLRQSASGAWDVRLRFPSFTPLTRAFPTLFDVLDDTAFVVSGGERPLPRGALLGGYEVTLNRWPAPGQALLRPRSGDI